jgi:hypothetical protein
MEHRMKKGNSFLHRLLFFFIKQVTTTEAQGLVQETGTAFILQAVTILSSPLMKARSNKRHCKWENT